MAKREIQLIAKREIQLKQKSFQPNFLPLSTSNGAEDSVLLATSLNISLAPITATHILADLPDSCTWFNKQDIK